MEHPDFRVPRWVLIESYRRYIDADRQWDVAKRAAQSWFPAEGPPAVVRLGDPESKVRRLYNARERARARLMLARAELKRVRSVALKQRHGNFGKVQIFLLST